MNKHSPDLFLEACGATGPLQLVTENPGKQEATRRVFYQPFALLGRDPRNDWALEDPQISRRHVYLQIIEGRVFFLDLGSRSGIQWINGQERSGWMDRHSPVRVGPYSIWLLGGDQPEAPVPDSGNPLLVSRGSESYLPRIRLEFLKGDIVQSSWLINRILVLVGRSPDCKVQLMTSTVSRLHCSLLRTRMGLWVMDLLARGGILVNGTQVRWAHLADGDFLQVGKMLIRVRYDARSESEAPPSASTAASITAPLSPMSTEPLNDDLRGSEIASPASTLPVPHSMSWQPLVPPSGGGGIVAGFTSMNMDALVPTALHRPGEEWVASVLMPIVNQFAFMQQQMFDQFQQTMTMMVQMFSSLHRDQMELIREELDRLQELTRELNELQTELARQQVANAAPPAASISSPPATALPTSEVKPESQDSRTATADALTPASAMDSAEVIPASQPSGEATSHVEAATPSADAGSEINGESPAPVPGNMATPPQETGAVRTDKDVHKWLCQRIAALQDERKTRWQKITSYLLGKRPGEPVP